MSSMQLTLADIKTAMKDPSFLATLPESMAQDVQKFIQNPNCACNIPLYKKLVKEAKSQLAAYFPTKNLEMAEQQISNIQNNQPVIQQQTPRQDVPKVENMQNVINSMQTNSFKVINCSIGEVEEMLRKLPKGRKQLAVARYEDQVTVIVNELDFG